MSNPPVAHKASAEALSHGLVRWVAKQVIFLLILAAVLFATTGRADGLRARAYLGLITFVQALTAVVLIPRSPGLLIERSRLSQGTKAWDVGLAVFMGYSPVLMAAAAGLETRLAGPPSGPDPVLVLAVLAALAGTGLTLWAMLSNPFFSGVVRIQRERGHTVVSSGPYQYVRHPGYVGMLVFTLATPLVLGSWWTLAVALLTVAVTVLRTVLEDRTLQRELAGYAEYACRVRYRLVPGFW